MNLLLEHLKRSYSDKKILILGWGREGQSTFHALQTACPDAQIAMSDKNPTQATPIPSEPYLEHLDHYDVIFKTPGISVRLPELQEFSKNGGVITSQLNEFLEVYRDHTYGVTGTKGKSTTSSLIEHFLRALGKHVILAGNIGTPVFDIAENITDETSTVIEMSSYQLESVTHSPHVAVLLNLFPEHINYHGHIDQYAAAKSHITHFQTAEDLLIFNQDNEKILQIANNSLATKIPFSSQTHLQYPAAVKMVLETLDNTTLPKTIKSWNVLPALLAISHELVNADDIAKVRHSLVTFQPLPHRLQTVSNEGGITWIDDTLATIPEATIAALEAVPHVDVLMLGGYDRGILFDKIVDKVITKKIPSLIFFKPSGETMYHLLRGKYPSDRWPIMHIVEDMKEAVQLAYQLAPKHGTVLLSPSSPSFGQFKDYEDKSRQFVHWITELAPGAEGNKK